METGHTVWYALHVRSRHECLVEEILRYKNYETFLPLRRADTPEFKGRNDTQLPLFPGYLFCKCNLASHSCGMVVTTPGVIRILGRSKSPTPIPDDQIEAVKQLVQSRVELLPWPFIEPGQLVMIRGGPLRGLRGCVLSGGSYSRFVVSVTLLQRSVAVKIERDCVSPLLS
jgi:transcriptional antiterminator NusG